MTNASKKNEKIIFTTQLTASVWPALTQNLLPILIDLILQYCNISQLSTKPKIKTNQAKRSACETKQVTTTVRGHYNKHAETKYSTPFKKSPAFHTSHLG